MSVCLFVCFFVQTYCIKIRSMTFLWLTTPLNWKSPSKMFYLKSFLSNLLDSCWASKIDLFIISQVAKRYRFYKPFLLTGTCGTNYYKSANIIIPGSCCGSVGRAVAFDTRGPRFKSSHRQTFISNIYLLSTVWKRQK